MKEPYEILREQLSKPTDRYLAVPLTYKDSNVLRALRLQPCLERQQALARFHPQSEEASCKVCGSVDGWDFCVDTETWDLVVPPVYREHTVCLACFTAWAFAKQAGPIQIQELTYRNKGLAALGLQITNTRSIDELLQDLWNDCMDSHPKGVLAMKTTLLALQRLGLVEPARAEMWRLRAEHTCPEQSGHSGGRAWCAYCLDIEQSDEAKESR